MRTLHIPTIGISGALLLAGLAGCPDRQVSEVVPNQDNTENKDIPLDLNRNLDLLFMVDNSSSMQSKQDHLRAQFPKFIQVLQEIEGGLPSVHIGVVTSDMGDGGFSGCPNPSMDGVLQNLARGGNGCTGPTDKYIVDTANPDGSRTTNFSGTLEDTFSCIAAVGAGGCGFEHQIQSVVRALTTQTQNAGFIRDDAYLGIVFVTDEDDCSASNDAIFDPSNNSLGPLASFRCTDYGLDCDQPMRDFGTKTNCKPNNSGPYLYDIDQQVAAIKAVKSDPKNIVVSAIMAAPDPVAVIPAPSTEMDVGKPFLQQSCTASFGHGDPAVRLANFVSQFPHNTVSSVCDEDYSTGLSAIATLLKEVIGDPCMQGNLKDSNPNLAGVQPDCVVSLVTDPGASDQTETILPECSPDGPGTHTNSPCWFFQTDTTHCASTPSQLSLSIDYGSATAPLNTHIKAQCVVQ